MKTAIESSKISQKIWKRLWKCGTGKIEEFYYYFNKKEPQERTHVHLDLN